MFKDIKGYEGLYQINKFGVVKSLARLKGSIKCKERILKYDYPKSGYLRVTLSKDNKTTKKFVHRLVYEAFVGDIPKGLTIHHIDENKHNNHIYNLLACTHRQNNHFSAKAKGYKLTQQDVDFIRNNNMTTKEIAEKYEIGKRHALRIIKYERWID